MNIVILFESGEGQTRKIADFIATEVRADGHTVLCVDTSDRMADLALDGADRVILAAPVHERRHPKNFEVAISAAKQDLATRPTLMLSVSLKAAFPEGLEEAEDYLTEMKMRTGFEPTQAALVAGAVQSGSYEYFQSEILRHVVLRGHDVDLTGGVKEYTDWATLSETVSTFVNA